MATNRRRIGKFLIAAVAPAMLVAALAIWWIVRDSGSLWTLQTSFS